MIEKTANLGLAAVTAIIAGVGVLMFLLPPVPGVPVYLTLGIVLSAQGYELLGKLMILLSFLSALTQNSTLISFIIGINCRLGWFNCLFYCNWTRVEAVLKCIATKDDWRESIALRQSKTVRGHQLEIDEGNAAGFGATWNLCSKSCNTDRRSWYVSSFLVVS